MEERLLIHDFGPIKEADVGVRDLTIFVGPQATGKSLAAQVLYFLRGIEDLLSSLSPSALFVDYESLLTEVLRWWLGNELSVYAGSGTLLSWLPAEPAEGMTHKIWWEQESGKINLSKTLENRAREWREMSLSRLYSTTITRSQVYIPAGRALYSFLPPYTLPDRDVQWPGHVIRFYRILGTAINRLWQYQEKESPTPFSENSQVNFVRQRIDSILKGQMRYGPGVILLDIVQKRLLPPTTIAAGQMEIWPFWAILEAGEILGSPINTQVYFEEPEAHLHPGAQRSVMEIIANLVRQGVRFVLTTHSPYILYAVNNFLMAQKVLDAGRDLPDGVSQETALRPDQVAAYRFSADGKVYDIMDAEVELIDEDELDRVADEMGATFTDLQERLAGVE